MNASTSVFWERLWRSSGIGFVVFFVIAYVVYGDQPKVGASAEKLVSFYDGDRTRILISTVIFGLGLLNLLWFVAALASVLRDAGQGGWGSAAIAAGAALGSLLFVLILVGAALAYSIAGSGNDALTSGLNDVVWVCAVIVSFPAAMLAMAGAFGLWRAGIISNAVFRVGVAVVVLVLLGGTTWASDGFWAPDGAYARFVAPAVGSLWILYVSWLLTRRLATEVRPGGRR